MNFNGINFNRIGFSGKIKFDSQANPQNNEVSCFTNILNNAVNKPTVAKYAIPEDTVKPDKPQVLKYAIPEDTDKPEKPTVAKYAIPEDTDKPEKPSVAKYAIPQEDAEYKKTIFNDLLF